MTNKLKRDLEKFFKPEDFYEISQAYCSDVNSGKVVDSLLLIEIQSIVVRVANEIIRKEIEKAPVVTKWSETQDGWFDYENYAFGDATHTAKLVCIEEIKHDPITTTNQVIP